MRRSAEGCLVRAQEGRQQEVQQVLAAAVKCAAAAALLTEARGAAVAALASSRLAHTGLEMEVMRKPVRQCWKTDH